MFSLTKICGQLQGTLEKYKQNQIDFGEEWLSSVSTQLAGGVINLLATASQLHVCVTKLLGFRDSDAM